MVPYWRNLFLIWRVVTWYHVSGIYGGFRNPKISDSHKDWALSGLTGPTTTSQLRVKSASQRLPKESEVIKIWSCTSPTSQVIKKDLYRSTSQVIRLGPVWIDWPTTTSQRRVKSAKSLTLLRDALLQLPREEWSQLTLRITTTSQKWAKSSRTVKSTWTWPDCQEESLLPLLLVSEAYYDLLHVQGSGRDFLHHCHFFVFLLFRPFPIVGDRDK